MRWELDFCGTLGISDFENRINYSMEYESKNSAQLG